MATARPQIDYAAVVAVKDNDWLRSYFIQAGRAIFERWAVGPSVEEREQLYARYVALKNFEAELYAECERILNGKSR